MSCLYSCQFSIINDIISYYSSSRLQKIQNACFRYSYGNRKYEPISQYKSQIVLHQQTHKINILQKPLYLFKNFNKFENLSKYRTRTVNLLVISLPYNADKLYTSLLLNVSLQYFFIEFQERIQCFKRLRSKGEFQTIHPSFLMNKYISSFLL